MDKLEGAEELSCATYPVWLRMLLVAKAKRNFTNARELNAATNAPGQKCTVILKLEEAGLRA
jgi:hypothetical protein